MGAKTFSVSHTEQTEVILLRRKPSTSVLRYFVGRGPGLQACLQTELELTEKHDERSPLKVKNT